ncbi:MAG: hypothetical protein ACOYMN_08345, partial [Roseimicrobium sp.]
MKLAFLLTLSCSLASLHAQAPANWQSAERAKILNGISSIPKLGAPGPVAIWGNLAFPVIAAADGGKAELALAAAAGYGKGRAFIFGHNSYLDSGGTTGALLVNAVNWVANKEKAKVGVKDANLAAFLDGKGFKAVKFDGALDAKKLRDFESSLLRGHQRFL